MMRATEVRALLHSRLEGELTPELWGYLVDKAYVAEVEQGLMSLDDLENEARRLLALGQRSKTRAWPSTADSPPQGPPQAYVRERALSDLVAQIAEEDPEVMAYRAKYLIDGLLAWADVAGWIESRAEEGGPATKYVTVALSSDADIVRRGRALRIEPATAAGDVVETSVKILRYAVAGDTWARAVATAAGTALDHLRQISESLAKSYAWQPAQAAVFVLTGVPPFIDPIRVTSGGMHVRNRVDCGWAARIVLDIDPAVPASEVERAYTAVRRRHGFDRQRAISERQARLAVAAADDSTPWRARMQSWNAEFPEWAYSAESNFRRDARRAQEHLLYPGG